MQFFCISDLRAKEPAPPAQHRRIDVPAQVRKDSSARLKQPIRRQQDACFKRTALERIRRDGRFLRSPWPVVRLERGPHAQQKRGQYVDGALL